MDEKAFFPIKTRLYDSKLLNVDCMKKLSFLYNFIYYEDPIASMYTNISSVVEF